MELINFQSSSVLNNQCLVCGTDSLSSYIDLTVTTSRTSHSKTQVKEKLQGILCDKWIPSETEISFAICLPCYQLVDQFDALEAQLKAIQDNLCDKYRNNHCRLNSQILQQERFVRIEQQNNVVTNSSGSRGKRATSTQKKKSPSRRKKTSGDNNNVQVEQQQPLQVDIPKKNKTSDDILLWQQPPVTAFENEMQHLPEMPGPSQQLEGMVEQQQQQQLTSNISTEGSLPVPVWNINENGSTVHANVIKSPNIGQLPEDLQEQENNLCKIIYDDDLNMLNPGERYRIGLSGVGEGNMLSYSCCYCAEMFVTIESLKSHVRATHHPEILTTQIPAHLGLGSKVNCGVQLVNVTALNDFGKPFVCLFCEGAFKFKSNIHLHYKEKHTPYKPFSCVDCQESFRRSMELSRHRVYYCPHRKRAYPGNEKK